MSNRRGFFLAALGALALYGCAKPQPVHPALWEVTGPKGEKAWLFGTIHALPEPVLWKSDKVARAMQGADLLVLEVAQILRDSVTQETFARLAISPNLPPLAKRVPPDLRDELAYEMRLSGYREGEFDHYETWAAMLTFQQAIAARNHAEAENGIDRALARDWNGRVDEFEGARVQLGIFDRLPEAEQEALLAATLRDANKAAARTTALQQAWATGDVDTIARSLDQDFADRPRIREALLTDRNRAWLAKLTAMLRHGAHPFVAVGTGHLVGPDGLPAQLAARGYAVKRLQ